MTIQIAIVLKRFSLTDLCFELKTKVFNLQKWKRYFLCVCKFRIIL